MTLPISGPISLGNNTGDEDTISLNRELGYPSPYRQPISFNDAAVRTLLRSESGGISMSNAPGTCLVRISSNTNNYMFNPSQVPDYDAGKMKVIYLIESGVTIGSTSTGVAAFTQSSLWHPLDQVFIINNGTIVGAGGNGSNSAISAAINGSGSSGGPALNITQLPVTITNNGIIGGGGGGGGAGGTNEYVYNNSGKGAEYYYDWGGPGGGGAGYYVGGGGSHAGSFYYADSGTLLSGGVGLAGTGYGGGNTGGTGGTGGALGSPGGTGTTASGGLGNIGGAGGSAGLLGYGVQYITWLREGTLYGGFGS